MKENKLRKIKVAAKIVSILLIIFVLFALECYFSATHFLCSTKIEGVDCSFLSLEKAIQKINEKKENEFVAYHFSNGKEYVVSLSKLGVRVDELQMKRIFEEQHLYPKQKREYNLNGFILSDADMIKESFSRISELQERNMIESEDAYMTWNGEEFLIQEEVLGNKINVEEAISFVQEKLKNEEELIDFSTITDIYPEIRSKDLEPEKEKLNAILKTTIIFELSDGSTVTLDQNTIKNWLYQDENGKFGFSIEQGVQEFVEELSLKVAEINTNMYFHATDCEGFAKVNLPEYLRVYLDKEKETAEIMSMLGNSEIVYAKPIYDRQLFVETLISYIEIDIARQHIWFYKNGELILETDCVTGNVSKGWDTPTGVFYLLENGKGTDVLLKGEGYSVEVDYWMGFSYRGIGLHSSERKAFGGDIYLTNGSHACVNMPLEAAKIAYENIDTTIPIIIYNSQC